MCKVCGCTPCKCGRDIVDEVCEGCKKPYDDCTCEKLESPPPATEGEKMGSNDMEKAKTSAPKKKTKKQR